MFVCLKYETFRISQVNGPDITFQITEKRFRYPKDIIYPKVVSDSRKNFPDIKNMFVCLNTKHFGFLKSMFRISHFREAFRIILMNEISNPDSLLDTLSLLIENLKYCQLS